MNKISIYVDKSLKEFGYINTIKAIEELKNNYKDFSFTMVDNIDRILADDLDGLSKLDILISSNEEVSKDWSVKGGKSFLVGSGDKCCITNERLIVGDNCCNIYEFIKKCSHIYDKVGFADDKCYA